MEETFARLNDAIRSVDAHSPVGSDLPTIVFIVGVPRSGTTLLSQLMSRFLEVGYIDNIVARFWANPVIGIRVSRAVLPPHSRSRIQLRSVHGTTDEPWGPHEFGYFWREMFGLDRAATHNLSPGEREDVDEAALTRRLREIAFEFGRPVVFKNPICGFQASLLERCYPNSLFISTERDDEQVAESIRKSRVERYGSDEVWWSLKPSTFGKLSNLRPVDVQIRAQISDSRTEFSHEFGRLGRPTVSVGYEEMRTDPLGLLHRLREQLVSLGNAVGLTEESNLLKSPKDVGLY
jgi:hypothetical protein